MALTAVAERHVWSGTTFDYLFIVLLLALSDLQLTPLLAL